MERDEACELVRECAAGGGDGVWQRFADSYHYRIRMIVLQNLIRLGRRAQNETVDELVQDVYCRLLDHDRRVLRECRARTESSVMGYFASICASVVVDFLRAQAALKRGGGTQQGFYGTDQGLPAPEALPDPRASPERELMLQEARRSFLESCRSLFEGPSRERNLEIFRLAFLEGWTSREIAARYPGMLKPCSIDSMIHRQRRLLVAHGVSVPER